MYAKNIWCQQSCPKGEGPTSFAAKGKRHLLGQQQHRKMLEVDYHFKYIFILCGKGNAKNHCFILPRKYMDRQEKVIDNIKSDNKSVKLDSCQHAVEKELRIFESTNSAYKTVRLNPLGWFFLLMLAFRKEN